MKEKPSLLALTLFIFVSGMSPYSIGFIFTTFISTVSLSQVWPVDALILATPYFVIGMLLGFIGIRLRRSLLLSVGVTLPTIIITTLSIPLIINLPPDSFDPIPTIVIVIAIWIFETILLAAIPLWLLPRKPLRFFEWVFVFPFTVSVIKQVLIIFAIHLGSIIFVLFWIPIILLLAVSL